jgi:hypothetical protein
MSQNVRTLIVAAVVIALGLLALNRAIPQQIPNALQIDQWDYLIESGNDVSLRAAKANGKDGWELVTVYRQNDSDLRAIYKRPLR